MRKMTMAEQMVLGIQVDGKAKRRLIAKKALVKLAVGYTVFSIANSFQDIVYQHKNKKAKVKRDLKDVQDVCAFLKSL